MTPPGQAARIERLVVLARPADLDSGEITDKGYINQRQVLKNRAELIELLYAEPPPAGRHHRQKDALTPGRDAAIPRASAASCTGMLIVPAAGTVGSLVPRVGVQRPGR